MWISIHSRTDISINALPNVYVEDCVHVAWEPESNENSGSLQMCF